MSVMTGAANFAASFISRSALRYPSGCGIPKLRFRFSLVSRPFWWPITITETPASRAQPPTTAGSSQIEAIAVQLDEVGEDGAEIVEGVRAAGVAGDHDPLDRGQVPVDLGAKRFELALQSLQLPVDVDLALAPDPLQVVDLALQLQERLLELQRIG